jgi:hypothetical protein
VIQVIRSEAQSLTNQMSKDEIWKKNSITQNDLKKYIIKRIKVKIKIKK